MKIRLIGQKGIPATWGGVEQHVEKLAVELTDLGHEVIVYGQPQYVDTAAAEAFVAEHAGLQSVVLPSLPSKHLDAVTRTLAATLHAIWNGADVFHYQGVGPALFSWLPRLLRPRARVIVTFHSIDRLHQKWGWFARTMLTIGEWAAVHFPHQTITVSQDLQQYIQRRYGAAAVYVPNGVPVLERAATQTSLERFGLTAGQYILFVARLIPHKNAHQLIQAFRGIESAAGLKLVIVGDSADTEQYVQQLHTLAGDDSRIVFTGYQTGTALAELYSHAGLYVQPSSSEGLSVSLLEAGAYGLPVLVSDIGPNLEAIDRHGLQFQTNNLADLKLQLQHCLAQPERLQQLGNALQAHIRRTYNWQAIARDTVEVYQSVVPALATQAVR